MRTERWKMVRFTALGNYDVTVVITDDFLKSRIKRKDILGANFKKKDFTEKDGVCVSKNGDTFMFLHDDADANTVAHESWHCIYRIMRWVGAEIEDEIVAHHLGYLVGQVTYFVEEFRRSANREPTPLRQRSVKSKISSNNPTPSPVVIEPLHMRSEVRK